MLDFIRDKKGIEYAKEKMFEFRKNAFEMFDGFEQNVYTESMKNLITFTTDRNY